MKTYLSADGMTNIMWWVDGSYGVHWDSKGHIGVMMPIGSDAIVNFLRIGTLIEFRHLALQSILKLYAPLHLLFFNFSSVRGTKLDYSNLVSPKRILQRPNYTVHTL